MERMGRNDEQKERKIMGRTGRGRTKRKEDN